MNKKEKFISIFLTILIIIALFVFFFLLANPNFFSNKKYIIQESDLQEDFFLNNNIIENLEDTYSTEEAPRFEELKTQFKEEQIIKDLPKNGNIRLGFYHFIGKRRKWDKIYYITKDQIEEKNLEADINLWIHSDYVNQFDGTNLCEIIKKAKANDDVSNSLNIGTYSFLWKYSSIMKYKDCLNTE
tara:strand:+ start:316 stop:873 length:558 start_codon:yes stop_codon:yes gene_type:complete